METVLTLDVVTEDFAVALGTALSEALSSLAASRHGCLGLLEARNLLKSLKDREDLAENEQWLAF